MEVTTQATQTQEAPVTQDRKDRKYHDTKIPFYVIFSEWSLREIETFLKTKMTAKSYIGPLHLVFDFNGEETKRTFVLLSDDVVDSLARDRKGYVYKPGEYNNPDFCFAKYRVPDNLVIENKSLCVPIPKRDLKISGSEAKAAINTQLKPFFDLRLLSDKDVRIVVPLESRESDIPKNAVYINFEQNVDNELISVIRASIDNVPWYKGGEKTNQYMICRFTKKDQRNREGKDDQKPGSRKILRRNSGDQSS